MSDMFRVVYEGSTLSIPIETFTATTRVSQGVPQPVHERAREELIEHVRRLMWQGYVLTEAPVLECEVDDLTYSVHYRATARGYYPPNAWTSVDDQVERDTYGGYSQLVGRDRDGSLSPIEDTAGTYPIPWFTGSVTDSDRYSR